MMRMIEMWMVDDTHVEQMWSDDAGQRSTNWRVDLRRHRRRIPSFPELVPSSWRHEDLTTTPTRRIPCRVHRTGAGTVELPSGEREAAVAGTDYHLDICRSRDLHHKLGPLRGLWYTN